MNKKNQRKIRMRLRRKSRNKNEESNAVQYSIVHNSARTSRSPCSMAVRRRRREN